MKSLFTKSLMLAVIGALIFACAFVFEASSTASIATKLVIDAREAQSPSVKTALLDRAVNAVNASWAHPSQWHAGASEVLSAAYFMRGDLGGGASDFQQSARWAARTTELASVEPRAWIRLAALAERGYANPICQVSACLDRSWQSARMLDADAACVRLQLAGRAHLLEPTDRKIADYLASGVSRRIAAQCLGVIFDPAVTFRLAMDAARPN